MNQKTAKKLRKMAKLMATQDEGYFIAPNTVRIKQFKQADGAIGEYQVCTVVTNEQSVSGVYKVLKNALSNA
jgi:hypothetical protein